MQTSKDIAIDIIAKGILRKGEDEVSKVYGVFMEVEKYIIEYMVKKREEERGKK